MVNDNTIRVKQQGIEHVRNKLHCTCSSAMPVHKFHQLCTQVVSARPGGETERELGLAEGHKGKFCRARHNTEKAPRSGTMTRQGA